MFCVSFSCWSRKAASVQLFSSILWKSRCSGILFTTNFLGLCVQYHPASVLDSFIRVTFTSRKIEWVKFWIFVNYCEHWREFLLFSTISRDFSWFSWFFASFGDFFVNLVDSCNFCEFSRLSVNFRWISRKFFESLHEILRNIFDDVF